jgi:hypothetical protein
VKAGLDTEHLVHELGGVSLSCSAGVSACKFDFGDEIAAGGSPVPTCLTVRGAVTRAQATVDPKQAIRPYRKQEKLTSIAVVDHIEDAGLVW